MAGDWIKIEKGITEKPEVMLMADFLNLTEFDIVGRLHALWAWVDSNSTDGRDLSIKDSMVDRVVRLPGFAEAMRQAGWLTGEDGSLSFPNFDRHNGKSAKARALESEAKRIRRASDGSESERQTDVRQNVRQMSDETSDRRPTNIAQNVRPEKRREEEENSNTTRDHKTVNSSSPFIEQMPASVSVVEQFISGITGIRPQSRQDIERCAEAFFDTFASRGWKDARGVPLADWRPSARQFARSFAENKLYDRRSGKPNDRNNNLNAGRNYEC